MDTHDKLINELLIDALEDDIWLWSIYWKLSNFGTRADDLAARAETILVLKELLDTGLVKLGELLPNGDLVAWDIPHEDALIRVQSEWSVLDRPLGPGDITWIILTEQGEEKASSLEPV